MISFELEDIKTSPNVEPLLVELIHQSAYRENTLGLPCVCPEENITKIDGKELKLYLASLYQPSRMVLTGVNVDHESFVDLARKYFVDVPTSWEGVEPKMVDQSVAQYTSYDVKVNDARYIHCSVFNDCSESYITHTHTHTHTHSRSHFQTPLLRLLYEIFVCYFCSYIVRGPLSLDLIPSQS